MELKDLVGLHKLSGVDLSTTQINQWGNHYEDAQVIRFVIDGQTYKATEDPSDGYRSQCEELEVTDEIITNMFPPQKVMGKMRKDTKYETNNTIEFTDVFTGKVVLAVGTDNFEDYYPCCVFVWNPENMAINIGK